MGIEVKAPASVTGDDFAGLRALREAAGGRFIRGTVLNMGPAIVPFEGQAMVAAPIVELWTA